jgi:hypothetical protein
MTISRNLSDLANQVNSSGTLEVAGGGTGQVSYVNGELLIGNSTGNTLTKSTLTAGAGITITNGTGSISIASTAGLSVGTTPPVSPIAGNLWYDTNEGILYTYYSNAWVDNSSLANMLPSEINMEGGNAEADIVNYVMDGGGAVYTNYPLQSYFDNGFSGTFGFLNTIEGGDSSTPYDVYGYAIDSGKSF